MDKNTTVHKVDVPQSPNVRIRKAGILKDGNAATEFVAECSNVMEGIVVSHETWEQRRLELLAAEKELTRKQDEVTRLRKQLPREKVETNYTFHTNDGLKSLLELFRSNDQLIVYHFMLGPDDVEGCHGCSFLADHFDGTLAHLNARNTSFVAVARAPLQKLNEFRERMGWKFNLVSSQDSAFNYDFKVSFNDDQKLANEIDYNYRKQPYFGSEGPGMSVFYRDESGAVYHTYSAFQRGLDRFIGTYQFLDSTPEGRNETGPMSWVKHHDKYVTVTTDTEKSS